MTAALFTPFLCTPRLQQKYISRSQFLICALEYRPKFSLELVPIEARVLTHDAFQKVVSYFEPGRGKYKVTPSALEDLDDVPPIPRLKIK